MSGEACHCNIQYLGGKKTELKKKSMSMGGRGIEKNKYKQMDRDTGPLRNLVRGLLLDL